MLSLSKHSGQRQLRSPFECLRVTPTFCFALFCLLLSMKALAQAGNKDTIKSNHPPVFIPGHPLIVVDGYPFDFDSLKNINRNDILFIDTLKSPKDVYINRGDYGVIIIATKQGAIWVYQKRFGKFSKEYKQYIDINKGDDGLCHYFIDGKSLDKSQTDFIKKLYQIPADKIRSIKSRGPRPIDSFVGLNVFITTKK